MPHHRHNFARFAERLHKGDPQAIAHLRKLAMKAGSNPKAAYALKCIAQEYRAQNAMFAGAIPGSAGHVVGKVLKLALSPVAWAAGTAGSGVKWVGAQLQHLAHAL
jgi:hypothetical protein